MTSVATATCRICGSAEVHHHRTMASLVPKAPPVTFVECESCGTVMDSSGSTQDYTPDGVVNFNTWPYHKYQLEVGAGLPFMTKLIYLAQCLAPKKGPEEKMQFLDVGGGLGLATEITKRLGWRGVNVEPSSAGEYCEKLLGVEVIHNYLAPGTLPEHSFDVILSSEVIEHVPDPDAFAATISSYLTADGVAILTTPNSEPARDPSIGEAPMELLETYNPGFHFTVFSPHALEQVLRRNGFNDVRVITSEGMSHQKRLVVAASRRAGSLPADLRAVLDTDKIEQQHREHLTWVVDTRQQHDEWYYGACYRLFEIYVNAAEYTLAERFGRIIGDHLRKLGLTTEKLSKIEASTHADFCRQVPAYAGKYCYFRGMHDLNHSGNLQEAAAQFHAAWHVLSILEEVTLCLGGFEWHARFHEALSLLRGGKRIEAVAIFNEMDKYAARLPGGLTGRVRWERAVAWLQMGNESAAISEFAAIALEGSDYVKPGLRAPVKHAMAAGLRRVDALQARLLHHNSRVERVATRVAGEIHGIAPQITARLDRLDHLAKRSHALADGIENRVDTGLETLTYIAQRGAEAGAQLQAGAQSVARRVDELVARGYGLSGRLESHMRTGTERLAALAERGLELSEKAESGLVLLNDMNIRLQQLFERHQPAARQWIARAASLLATLQATVRTMQTSVDFLHRGTAKLGSALSLPVRCARGAWRTAGRWRKQLSVRNVGWLNALEVERRIPLGEILPGTVIEQQIAPRHNGWSGVWLTFRTAPGKNASGSPLTCTVQLAVVDAQGLAVRQAEVEAAKLPDGSPSWIGFERIDDSAGRNYRLRITSSDSNPGNAVTLWSRLTKSPRGMTYNGKLVDDGELIMELDYARDALPPLSIMPSLSSAASLPARAARSTARAPLPPPMALPPGAPKCDRDLLIVCPDRLGSTRIGLAMRHWEIAQALSESGLRVTLASTQALAADLPAAPFPIVDFSDRKYSHAAVAQRHAAIMVQGGALKSCPWLRDAGRPLVADMITPFHIENIQTSQDEFQRSLAIITDSLCKADFYICGNERQRIYWLGMLTALDRLSKTHRDRDPEFRKLIDVVGFGIPVDEPQTRKPALKGVVPGIQPGDFVLTWFGGIWDWLDPLPLVQGVHAAHQADPRIKLFFSMYRRANEQPTQTAQRVRKAAIELGALDKCIFFSELPVPFDERADYLLDSDMGVILQSPNFETQISARTRAMDYLWANLPILINRGDEIAEIVESYGLGLVLDSSDPAAIGRSLVADAGDPSRSQAAREAIGRHKTRFQWSRMVQPLINFCQETAAKSA